MSLIIDDQYFDEVREYITQQCEVLEEVMLAYRRTMLEVVEKGISEGQTSKALEEFILQLQNKTTNNGKTPSVLGIESNQYLSNFIEKVDKTDKGLY